MFKRYMLRLLARLIIAGGIIYIYLFRRELLPAVFDFRPFTSFSLPQILWLLLMADMICHLLPRSALLLAGRKKLPRAYCPPPRPIDRPALMAYSRRMNIRAARMMLLWLTGNAFFAILYFTRIIGPAELLLLWAAFFAGDMICMLFFCPFQKWLIKCRCCLDCRVADWGHFMMYTPLLFIKSFFSWSLFFTACLVLLHWEISCYRHPERFWPPGNKALQCGNCTDRLCRIKRPLKAPQSE